MIWPFRRKRLNEPGRDLGEGTLVSVRSYPTEMAPEYLEAASPTLAFQQIIDAHNQLDRVSIPRDGHDMPIRVAELVDRYIGLFEKARDLASTQRSPEPSSPDLLRETQQALGLSMSSPEPSSAEQVERWTVSDPSFPLGVESDSFGPLVFFADHQATVERLEHEKYELRIERDIARGQSGLEPFTDGEGESYSPATQREQAWAASSAANQQRAEKAEARATQLQAVIDGAVEEFERRKEGALKRRDDLPFTQTEKRLGYEKVAYAYKLAVALLRSNQLPEPEAEKGSRGSATRREAAVDELLAIALLADDNEMRKQLEALASRFSYPPRRPSDPEGEQ